MLESDLYSLKEASRILHVHPNTLRLWEKKGILPAVRFGLRKDRRYKRKNLEKLLFGSSNLEKEKKEDILRISDVIEKTADAVFITDKNAHFQYVNPAFERMTGFKRREILDNTPKLIKSGQHPESFYKKLWSTILSGKTFRAEFINKRKTGELFYVDHTITPIKSKSGEVVNFVGIWKDITRQKELEKRKDEFISIASHELRTPLSSIKAYGQILENHLRSKKDDQSLKYIHNLNRQINVLVGYVADLLDVGRIQTGKLHLKKEVFPLKDLIGNTLENMTSLNSSHKFILKGKINKKIYADKDRLNQVIINLLTNAVKYSPGGDKIMITVNGRGSKLVIGVADSGIGISKDEQTKIFGRFYQAHGPDRKNYSGLGLGLYISKGIIEKHGGKMWVKSIPKKGSTFYFSIPIY